VFVGVTGGGDESDGVALRTTVALWVPAGVALRCWTGVVVAVLVPPGRVAGGVALG
jgi:hypothetical protein